MASATTYHTRAVARRGRIPSRPSGSDSSTCTDTAIARITRDAPWIPCPLESPIRDAAVAAAAHKAPSATSQPTLDVRERTATAARAQHAITNADAVQSELWTTFDLEKYASTNAPTARTATDTADSDHRVSLGRETCLLY